MGNTTKLNLIMNHLPLLITLVINNFFLESSVDHEYNPDLDYDSERTNIKHMFDP